MKTALLTAILTLIAAFTPLRAAEPPALTKVEAEKIFKAMDYDRVQIVAVVPGVHQKGVAAMSCSTVIALGRRNLVTCEVVLSFFYDQDLGWFFYESQQDKIRLWNAAGYKELKF